MKTSQALLLGISLILSSLVFGLFFYSSRHSRDTVQVVGMAMRDFETDIVKWSLQLQRSTDLNNADRLYSLLADDIARIKGRLIELGIAADDIVIQPVNSNPTYGQNGISGYQVNQVVSVVSGKMEQIEELALNPQELISSGTMLGFSRLEYFYSEVDQLKRDLLAAATTDARLRAENIASSGTMKVGKLVSARQGVFQITEPYSTKVNSYGIYNTATSSKQIKVTIHAKFELK